MRGAAINSDGATTKTISQKTPYDLYGDENWPLLLLCKN
jgi:hypothetical protein